MNNTSLLQAPPVVMKFGGASVKDAPGVRNVGALLHQWRTENPSTPLVVVVSAMDKTTNALELLAQRAAAADAPATQQQRTLLEQFHYQIIGQLFGPHSAQVGQQAEAYFTELQRILQGVLLLGEYPYHLHDRIMAFGELLSSVILHAHLAQLGMPVHWHDARTLIHTDATFTQAEVLWASTEAAIQAQVWPLLAQGQVVVTQGYIGATPEGRTTTLGREGSDYTASLLAQALRAQEVVVWKDVEGVLTADPRTDPQLATKLDALSYETAVEMTFYGASVIHPKTIKPLQNAGIPLRVKCFKDASLPGTVIGPEAPPPPPMRLHRKHQAMLCLRPQNFSFMDEGHLRRVFDAAGRAGLQVTLVQSGARKLTLVADHTPAAVAAFNHLVAEEFELNITPGLRLTSLLFTGALPPDLAVLPCLLLQQDDRHLHVVVRQP